MQGTSTVPVVSAHFRSLWTAKFVACERVSFALLGAGEGLINPAYDQQLPPPKKRTFRNSNMKCT